MFAPPRTWSAAWSTRWSWPSSSRTRTSSPTCTAPRSLRAQATGLQQPQAAKIGIEVHLACGQLDGDFVHRAVPATSAVRRRLRAAQHRGRRRPRSSSRTARRRTTTRRGARPSRRSALNCSRSRTRRCTARPTSSRPIANSAAVQTFRDAMTKYAKDNELARGHGELHMGRLRDSSHKALANAGASPTRAGRPGGPGHHQER